MNTPEPDEHRTPADVIAVQDFIGRVLAARSRDGKPVPASCLYVEQSGHSTTAYFRLFRPAPDRDEVNVGHAYSAEKVPRRDAGFCDACGRGDSQGCDECVAEGEPGRTETPCVVCGCRWCGPEVFA
jgi:hypothetical protein